MAKSLRRHLRKAFIIAVVSSQIGEWCKCIMELLASYGVPHAGHAYSYRDGTVPLCSPGSGARHGQVLTHLTTVNPRRASGCGSRLGLISIAGSWMRSE